MRLANKWEHMPRAGQPAVVQEYISEPHLIDGKKYDCRIYVAVTSFDPLRAYLYEEGLVRFATSNYKAEHTGKSIRNRSSLSSRASRCAAPLFHCACRAPQVHAFDKLFRQQEVHAVRKQH